RAGAAGATELPGSRKAGAGWRLPDPSAPRAGVGSLNRQRPQTKSVTVQVQNGPRPCRHQNRPVESRLSYRLRTGKTPVARPNWVSAGAPGDCARADDSNIPIARGPGKFAGCSGRSGVKGN